MRPTEIVAGVNKLGYLKCVACMAMCGEEYQPVYAGSVPHAYENCDRCHKPLDKDRAK